MGNGRGDLQAALEDDLLPLEANIFRPFYKSGEVRGGLNVLTWKPRGSGTENLQNGIHSPIPKFLGVDSNNGFLTVLVWPFERGAGAGFLPVLLLAGWSLRQSQSSGIEKRWPSRHLWSSNVRVFSNTRTQHCVSVASPKTLRYAVRTEGRRLSEMRFYRVRDRIPISTLLVKL